MADIKTADVENKNKNVTKNAQGKNVIADEPKTNKANKKGIESSGAGTGLDIGPGAAGEMGASAKEE